MSTRVSVASALPPPMRDGVGPSCVALPAGDWPTIADFLIQRFPAVGAARWQARIAGGEVVDEHGVAVTPQRCHQPRLRVYYYRSVDAEPRLPFDEVVLFQDELLVAVDKPHFLPMTPGGRHLQETLLVRLKRRLGIATLVPLHRLDRETAGVVVFGVQPGLRDRYHALFRERRVDKQVEAIAAWRADLALPLLRRSRIVQDTHFMRMREAPGEPNAQTHISVLERSGGLARYRLSPLTGLTHQLRVHCAALGLPILNDLMYPTLSPAGSDDHARPLQLLARSLGFTDPLTGEAREFTSLRALSWPIQGEAVQALAK